LTWLKENWGFASCLAILAAIVLYCAVIFVGGGVIYIWMLTSPSLWEEDAVVIVCRALDLKADEFCTRPIQTRETVALAQALRRRYMVDNMSYYDIIPHFERLKLNSVSECQQSADETAIRDISFDSCPIPESCLTDYICTFMVRENREEISVHISHTDGQIMDLVPTVPPYF
jgi:hypothetical protein